MKGGSLSLLTGNMDGASMPLNDAGCNIQSQAQAGWYRMRAGTGYPEKAVKYFIE